MTGAEAMAGRLTQAMAGGFDLATIYLGWKLGWFAGLRDLEVANSGELAIHCRTSERYTREWLETAAIAGLIAVTEQAASGDGRRYALLPGSAAVLCDTDGDEPVLHDLVCAMAGLATVPDLVAHFRDGTGLPFSAYGDDMRTAQALSTRRGYRQDLGAVWMPALGEIYRRLREQGGRIADLGFGAGWSTIALAQTFPLAEVLGIDLDPASVDLARENAEAAGVGERITFAVRDAAEPELGGQFDLVCIFEALHDLGRPVPVLRALRRMLAPGGCVLTGDPGVDDLFVAPGDEDARVLAGFSLAHCLPVGMDGPDAVGTGARMRPATVQSYARAAGFGSIEQLPIPHPSWRFYRFAD